MAIDPNIKPCNEPARQAESWVECPPGSGKPARNTYLCNYEELAQAIADKLPSGGGGALDCDNKVVDIIGGTPLTVTTTNLVNICDFKILDEFGNEIDISAKLTGATTIELCSNVSLNNIQINITGESV